METPQAVYLHVLDVVALHQEIMVRYGQEAQLRENGEVTLESALMRPQMSAHYEGADLAKQMALLTLGIAQAHPFVDGNKRVAFAAGFVFLWLNGYIVSSEPGEIASQIEKALTQRGSSTEAVERLAGWIGERLVPQERT